MEADRPPAAPRRPRKSGRIGNGLVALSSAAVVGVYAAGYVRTKPAADHLTQLTEIRAHAAPLVAETIEPLEPAAVPSPPIVVHPPVAPAVVEPPAPTEAAPPPAAAPQVAEAVTSAPEIAAPAVPATPDATAPADAAAPAPAEAKKLYKDGTYTGWGYSRHGDIQAAVVIESGRISSAKIVQCLTRYSCSVISQLIPEVAGRQSADVDYISGATQSSDAFYGAITQALAQALGK